MPEHVGRIRLNESEARYLYWLLEDERIDLLLERKQAQKEGRDIHPYQQDIHYVRNMRNEVGLLMEQKGWDIGQQGEDDERPAPI